MSIVKGKVSFKALYAPSGMPENWAERMESKALPEIGSIEERVIGWSGWKHIRSREFCKLGGYPSGMLVIAMRKIPKSTLDAEIAQEELAVMSAECKGYINHARRAEIRNEVKERILPDMPITYKSIEWVYIEDKKMVICTATSIQQMEIFLVAWNITFRSNLMELGPFELAGLHGYEVRDWPSVSFGYQGELFCVIPGGEFLLWLWFCSETGYKAAPIMIEGPIELAHEYKRVQVRTENVSVAAETIAALTQGMLPIKLVLHIYQGEDVWKCTINSEGFVFSGTSLPCVECFDHSGRFAERVVHLSRFMHLFTVLYTEYCSKRQSDGWRDVVRKINEWIDGKAKRAGIVDRRV